MLYYNKPDKSSKDTVVAVSSYLGLFYFPPCDLSPVSFHFPFLSCFFKSIFLWVMLISELDLAESFASEANLSPQAFFLFSLSHIQVASRTRHPDQVEGFRSWSWNLWMMDAWVHLHSVEVELRRLFSVY